MCLIGLSIPNQHRIKFCGTPTKSSLNFDEPTPPQLGKVLLRRVVSLLKVSHPKDLLLKVLLLKALLPKALLPKAREQGQLFLRARDQGLYRQYHQT